MPDAATRKCTHKRIPLNVINNGDGGGGGGGHAPIAKSRMGPRRAAVLIGVHVVIAIHIVLWLIMGSTLSPVEPSESMQTLELGVVNLGFIFFVLAIGSTMIMGRFFCGWGCHFVALQDLCAWIMRKCGVHPKPFRSRLLILVPLVLALYMFVWPNFKRWVLIPLFGDLPFFLKDVATIHRFESEIIVEDFWATFAAWPLALATLFISGFSIVYFLGSKGFCTYGCPYGGFFAPIDKLATGRIRVTDACEGCGHCTAVCTSNVRVHEEVRDFGMVVDPGCMKCMDCVSVCPNEALYVGMGLPAILAKPKDDDARQRAAKAKASRKRRYDLEPWEEIVCGLIFFWLFMAFRQFAYAVPMLMAVGIAGIGTFCIWKLWSLVIRPNVTLQSLRLKYKGRVRTPGWILAGVTVLFMGMAAWAGIARYNIWQGNLSYGRLDVPLATALRREFVPRPATIERAHDTVRHYDRLWSPGRGGYGFGLEPDRILNLAYANILLGESDRAVELLRERVETGSPIDSLVFELGDLMRWAGRPEQDIIDTFAWASDLHPELHATRAEAARAYVAASRVADAEALWARALDAQPDDPLTLLAAARFALTRGELARARELLDRAGGQPDTPAGVRIGIAGTFASLGDRDRAVAMLDEIVEDPHVRGRPLIDVAGLFANLSMPSRAGPVLRRVAAYAGTDAAMLGAVAQLAMRTGDREYADEITARVRALVGPNPEVSFSVGQLLYMTGDREGAIELWRTADAAPGLTVWDRLSIGGGLFQLGAQGSDPEAMKIAFEVLARVEADAPDSPTVQHDVAMAYMAADRVDEAVVRLLAAAELGAMNPALAQRVSDVMRTLGRTDEADRWAAEARRRFEAMEAKRAAARGA